MIDPQELPDVLRRHVSAFVRAAEPDLAALCDVLALRLVRRHQVLSRQDDLAPHLHFVERGCLRCYSTDSRGYEHVVRFAVEGWWLSDFHSYFTGEPSCHSIDALEDSRLLVMSRTDQERLCAEHPVFDRYFRRLLEGLAVASHRRLLGMMAGTAAERYDEFLRTYRSIAERLPQHQIASYLGMTPEALSRIRARIARHAGATRDQA